MTSLLAQLLLMLLLIVAASELFTNALEHLGSRLGISEGVTGSLFAAVGTALPETLVPLLALFAGTSNAQVNADIGIGAILGAPLMLSTLSTCLMAAVVLPRRGWRGRLHPERTGLLRDLHFFLAAFAVACAAMLVPAQDRTVRFALGFFLVLLYFLYLMLTLHASRSLVADGHGTEAPERMMLARTGLAQNLATICLQLALGLGVLLVGARGFIDGVEGVSQRLGMSPLVLSLLVIPIATELPEKVNSILWVRRGKDTLAMGNITGAMVFQGTLLPAIGIMATAWEPRPEIAAGIVITLLAAAWIRLNARHGGIPIWALMVNGALYLAYLTFTLLPAG